MCVRALLCLVFILAVNLGNKVTFYPLSPLTLQVTVNSCNATQTILNPSVPEICNFSNSSHPLFVIVNTAFTDLERMEAWVWLSVPGVEPSDLLHGHAGMNMHARCESVGALTNWASQTDKTQDTVKWRCSAVLYVLEYIVSVLHRGALWNDAVLRLAVRIFPLSCIYSWKYISCVLLVCWPPS